MTKIAIALLSMAGVTGVVAAPYVVKEVTNLGSYVSQMAGSNGGQGSAGHGFVVRELAKNGATNSLNAQRLTTSELQLTATEQSVPISGSTFFLFGIGFFTLAIWHRWRQGRAA